MRTIDVVPCSPVRTPIGTYAGSLKSTPATELGTTVIRESRKCSGLAAEKIQTIGKGAGDSSGFFGIGLVPAVRQALARAGRQIGDVDRMEVNEPFAAIACTREPEFDPGVVNVEEVR